MLLNLNYTLKLNMKTDFTEIDMTVIILWLILQRGKQGNTFNKLIGLNI
jgi:hypothetical protein